jgi:hypothetical protein
MLCPFCGVDMRPNILISMQESPTETCAVCDFTVIHSGKLWRATRPPRNLFKPRTPDDIEELEAIWARCPPAEH